MHTVTVYIKNSDPLMPYLKANMTGSRAVRNTVNFLIRNTYTALHKEPLDRTANENAVLLKVWAALNEANRRKEEYHNRMAASGKAHELKLFRIPDAVHSMLSYGQLDAILKLMEDEAYYSCTSQVNQQAIRKTCASWKAYFASLKEWKKHPERFCGKPNIPGYLRDDMATAHFTSQVSHLNEAEDGRFLSFANTERTLCLGDMPAEGSYVKTEFCPSPSGCRAVVTFDDDRQMPEVPETAERILAIDPGVDNFAACVSNTGMRPFLIDGKYLKSVNHWYNKRLAFLKSCLTAGKDPQDRNVRRSSTAIGRLSERRNKVMRDWFYKSAHRICRKAAAENVTLILYGHDPEWKQNADLGRENNQNFVQIPFMTFFGILRCVAAKYGIAADTQEESYSSRSDFLCGDRIPVFGEKNADARFSGKRITRGLYRSGTGDILNADVNGAANILRKRFPKAFDGTDKKVLLSVDRIGRCELYPGAKFRTASGFGLNRYGKKETDALKERLKRM